MNYYDKLMKHLDMWLNSLLNFSSHVDYIVAVKGKGKGRTLDIAPQVEMATTEALRYMARTKQHCTYLSYTFPAIAGTHLPTPRGWTVE